MNKQFNYGTGHLSIGICLDIASGKTKGVITEEAAARVLYIMAARAKNCKRAAACIRHQHRIWAAVRHAH